MSKFSEKFGWSTVIFSKEEKRYSTERNKTLNINLNCLKMFKNWMQNVSINKLKNNNCRNDKKFN